MELVGFDQGDPQDVVGSLRHRGLFAALQAAGALHDSVDVEVRGQERYLLTAREFSLRRRRWHHNLVASPHLFNARSVLAADYLQQRQQLPDAVLQTGTQFDATRAFPQLTRFCYLDATCLHTPEVTAGVHDPRPGYNARERERRLYAQSAALFVSSEFARRSLIEDFAVPNDKIHVVYGGVDITGPSPSALARREPMILFIARDFERRGGPLLLRAFARVRRSRPNTRLVIAGCSPQVKQRGVHIAGITKATHEGRMKLAALYASASAFSVPVRHSTFPGGYVEAMHHGVPCIGVHGGVMPEIIVDRVTGLLIPPDDEAALADALISILQSRRTTQQFGEAGARRAHALFTWEHVAGKMMPVMARRIHIPASAQAA